MGHNYGMRGPWVGYGDSPQDDLKTLFAIIEKGGVDQVAGHYEKFSNRDKEIGCPWIGNMTRHGSHSALFREMVGDAAADDFRFKPHYAKLAELHGFPDLAKKIAALQETKPVRPWATKADASAKPGSIAL